MEWDKKVEMIRLGNKAIDKDSRAELHKFVLEHINTFDEQAWDMLLTTTELIEDDMREDIAFYEQLYPIANTFNDSGHKLGLRSAMRLALLLTIYDERLRPKNEAGIISRKFRFNKEADSRWFVELPEWEGSKADLEMVAGADTMLEYMAEGNDHVNLYISEKEFEGADRLEMTRIATELGNGAYYKIDKFRGIEIGLEMWLCDVTKYIFNRFPKTIFIACTE